MRPERDRDRMIRDRAVEIVPVGKTLLLQAKVLHRTAVRDDPRAFRRLGGMLGEHLQDIANRIRLGVKIPAVDELHFRGALLRKMHVRVGETGNRGAAFEVNLLGRRAGEPPDFVGSSGRDDTSSGGGERFVDRAVRGEAAYLAVVKNQIGMNRASAFHRCLLDDVKQLRYRSVFDPLSTVVGGFSSWRVSLSPGPAMRGSRLFS